MGRRKQKPAMTNSYGTIHNSYKQQNKARKDEWLKERGLLPKKKKKKKRKNRCKMGVKKLRNISQRIEAEIRNESKEKKK